MDKLCKIATLLCEFRKFDRLYRKEPTVSRSKSRKQRAKEKHTKRSNFETTEAQEYCCIKNFLKNIKSESLKSFNKMNIKIKSSTTAKFFSQVCILI